MTVVPAARPRQYRRYAMTRTCQDDMTKTPESELTSETDGASEKLSKRPSRLGVAALASSLVGPHTVGTYFGMNRRFLQVLPLLTKVNMLEE
jgi:hypothetical protein